MSGPRDSTLAARLVAETNGSPLALVELAAGQTAHQLAADAVRPDPLPISRRLETHFLRKVRTLPTDTQAMLALASADGSGDPTLLASAADTLELPFKAMEAAEVAGLSTSRSAAD